MVSKKLLKRGFREALERFKRAPTAVMIFDDEGRLLSATNKALSLFGVPNKSNLPSKTLEGLFGEPSKQFVLKQIKEAAAGKIPLQTTALFHRKTRNAFKDTLIHFSIEQHDGGKSRIYAHLSDVGELFERSDFVSNVFGIIREINSQRDLNKLMQEIADQTAKHFNAVSLVWQVEKEKLHLKGSAGIPFTDARKAEWLDFGKGLAGTAASTRRFQELSHIRELTGTAIPEIDEKYALGHSIAIPLIAKNGNGEDVLIGVIGLYKKENAKFFDYQIELLKFISETAVTKIRSISLNEKLKHQATHDSLTGLKNRRGFFEGIIKNIGIESFPQKTRVAEAVNKLIAVKPFTVIYADLNNLKLVNDSFGHLRGNQAIQTFADFLKKEFPNAVIGRLGGDEFAIFVPSVKEKINLSRKLEEKFSSLIKEKHPDLAKKGFGASIGHFIFSSKPESEFNSNWLKIIKEHAARGDTLSDLITFIITAAEQVAMTKKSEEKIKREEIRFGYPYSLPEFLKDLNTLFEKSENKTVSIDKYHKLLEKHGLKRKPLV